jgi:cytochrome c peroxidase
MRTVRKGQRWQSAALLVTVSIVLGLAANRTARADSLLKPILPDVSAYVADPESALVLGKALFFDEQVGSDGAACASCHYSAGADSRIQNQLSPGLKDITKGPNGDKVGSQRSDTVAVARVSAIGAAAVRTTRSRWTTCHCRSSTNATATRRS